MGFFRKLLGALEDLLNFFQILGISYSQVTFIFFRGVETTDQVKIEAKKHEIESPKTVIQQDLATYGFNMI